MAPDALRILDANLNRAREALRLLEDYARFSLDSIDLAEPVKAIRHELVAATAGIAREAMLHRDTPGDIGTALSTSGERQRDDLESTVTAAGKRFGEAVRVIEELLKIAAPDAAARVEALRYRFYDLEGRIGLTFRPSDAFSGVRIYVLITEAFCRADWLATAGHALAGGADVLQLREPGLPAGELLARARRLRDLCREAGKRLIINDRPDIALIAKADGVHVGQADLPAADVRRLVGRRLLVGVSTHNPAQVRQARLAGADYVGVGPVFASRSKPRPEMADHLPGLAFAREAAGIAGIPTVAIAGISPGNAAEVWQTGVTAIAVGSAVTQSPDPAGVVRELRTGIPAARMN